MNMEDDKNTIFQMRFPQKLWYLMNLRSNAILWGGTGRTLLLNYKILDAYLRCDNSVFKTTHISSFIRQLNLYGFRKVTSHFQDPLCNSSNPDMHEYVHDFFQYGHPELLNKITRKTQNFIKAMANNKKEFSVSVCSPNLLKARKALRLALKRAAQQLYPVCPERSFPKYEIDYKKSCASESIVPKSDIDWKQIDNPNCGFSLRDYYKNSALSDELPDSYVCPQDEYKLSDDIEEDESLSQLEMSYNNTAANNMDNHVILLEVLDPSGYQSDDGADGNHGQIGNPPEPIQNDPLDYRTFIRDDSGDVKHEDWMLQNNTMESRDTTDCGTELKELFFQITKTMDLLNS